MLDTYLQVYSFDDSIFTKVLFLLIFLYIHDFVTIVIGAGMGSGRVCKTFIYQPVPLWPWHDHTTSNETGFESARWFHAYYAVYINSVGLVSNACSCNVLKGRYIFDCSPV